MSLDDLACDRCGMRFADVVLYREHLLTAHDLAAHEGLADEATQPEVTGMPAGSLDREDHPPRPEEFAGTGTDEGPETSERAGPRP